MIKSRLKKGVILMDIAKILEMLEMQKQLDERILEEHDYRGINLFPKKVLALYTELGELANETRTFKYWSNKSPSSRDNILEEYVDCLHFILSMAADLKLKEIKLHKVGNRGTLTDRFLDLFEYINIFANRPFHENYELLLSHFLDFGYILDFEDEEIYSAYIKKNKINHKRQDEGY